MTNDEYITIYAIIPSYLCKTKELTSEEKLIAERITALCRKERYSWISNKSLADMYGIREDTVSKHIKKLKDIGFIKCLYNKDANNKSNRVIYLTNNVWDKYSNYSSSNNQQDIGHISKYNNKYNYKNNSESNILNDIISYDTDGVMLWHGKRCESTPCTIKEQKEMEELLSEFRGVSIE